ncbi:neutral zinc metallopeptidase [Geodermatophilus sp. YIM 151500]|uniref:neutral zinc metallopeptidase n=1 Tax=Geodermatophilus sp. YIM 151500 TaxID=2984531 RepID=UPI0021E4943F|nr:neutral zinc metallopeptidase [Geodermatophilus sp. YIM 151500]MCV2488796.1 neutral zinc metallopeptidase [Geodermatophilus sp. YIM 151500]
MPHPPWSRAVAVPLLLVALLVAGCSVVVIGRPSPLAAPVPDVPAGEVPVVGAGGGPVDDLARAALADLETYWSQTFPDLFGQEFPPLAGGYFSVDPADVVPGQYPQGVTCGADPLEVADNAFYCAAPRAPNSDSITYDRRFLGELAAAYGRFIPALVMAHEFGHAIQARVGYPEASIVTETQADCLAGAWTAWVAAGEAEFSQIRTPELDQLLRGYLLLRDPVGTDLRTQSAHGSYFDRVSAFQEGFADGPTACRDGFAGDRVFTQGRFSTDDEALSGGNASYPELLDIVDRTLPATWSSAFTELGARFDPPRLGAFAGRAPRCADDRDRDLVFCADEQLVAFDERDLTQPAYEDFGDFAVATAVAIPYGLAVREQLGLSVDDGEALRSAVCLAGWYGRRVFEGQTGDRTRISPGDIDESVQFLLTYGGDPDVLPGVDLTGFQLVDLFRNGFVQGLPACDIGA